MDVDRLFDTIPGRPPVSGAGAVHELKCWPAYFDAIWEGRKRFELRRDDRPFMTDDVLFLREYEPGTKRYSGRIVVAHVDYVMTPPAPGLAEGYVGLQIGIMHRMTV